MGKNQQPGRNATAKSADQERFLSLIDSHQLLLLRVCWVYTRSSHDRDDLFQEIVGRLWAVFGRYDRQRTFSTWMYRVALNVAIDFRRRQHRRGKETRSLDDAHDPPSPQDAPRQEMLEELRELLERRSEEERAMLLLYLEGNSYREIAEVIGISESNLGTRLNRLKKSLRQSAHSSKT